MKETRFPSGWNEDRIRTVLSHYESQSEEEAVAEDRAAFETPDQTVMKIPMELVPEIRNLLASTEQQAAINGIGRGLAEMRSDKGKPFDLAVEEIKARYRK